MRPEPSSWIYSDSKTSLCTGHCPCRGHCRPMPDACGASFRPQPKCPLQTPTPCIHPRLAFAPEHLPPSAVLQNGYLGGFCSDPSSPVVSLARAGGFVSGRVAAPGRSSVSTHCVDPWREGRNGYPVSHTACPPLMWGAPSLAANSSSQLIFKSCRGSRRALPSTMAHEGHPAPESRLPCCALL